MQLDVSAAAMTMSERADALEEHKMHELEHIITKSVLFNLADGKVETVSGAALMAQNPGKYMLMGADPRLPKMPDKPTLGDYFRCRFASTAHLLQSATHALKAGHVGKEAQRLVRLDRPAHLLVDVRVRSSARPSSRDRSV